MKRLFLLCLLVCRVASAQTLAPETEARLRELCDDPKLADARVGVSVMAIGKAETARSFPSAAFAAPRVLFERDAEKRFTPASNMKLYTAALALKSMGAERKFTTRVRMVGRLYQGTFLGNLILEGSGDPSLDFADMQDLARQVRAAGVKKFYGNVWLGAANPEETMSPGLAENFNNLYPDGWTLDDVRWYYGPEVSAWTVHRNQIDVIVTGGAKEGDPAIVTTEQPAPGVQVADGEQSNYNRSRLLNPEPIVIFTDATTGGKELAAIDDEDLLTVERRLGRTLQITVKAKVAPGQKITVGVAVPAAAEWAKYVFQDSLAKVGLEDPRRSPNYVPAGGLITIPKGPEINRIVASHDSPPVGELLKKFLKTSDNLYGELLLRLTARADLSARGKKLTEVNYANYAHDMLRDYLQTEGIDADGLRFSDGSGLSRYNLVTPRATAQLLASVERIPGGQFFWDAMPIAGVDGTLRKRMKGTPAQNNARAKTGTFSIVSCLSGYVTTKDGTRLAVSVMTNFARSGDDARRVQNGVFETLAGAELSKQ